MSLSRTASGLRSLHRFLGVDIVVYCEGKRNGGEGQEYDNTSDVYYWSKVVSALKLNKKYHFKSLGSKSTLRKTAEDAASNNIATITVCVDSDYDNFIGFKFSTDRTCRTYGYSWENDVLHEEVFFDIIEDYIGIGPAQTAALAEAKAAIKELEPVLAKWIEIDLSLVKIGKGCVFDRERPTACMDFECHPNLREAALAQKLNNLGYTRRPRRIANIPASDSWRVCYGKLWSKNLYHFGMKILSKFEVSKLPYDTFMRQAIAATFRRVTELDNGGFLLFHRAQATAFA